MFKLIALILVNQKDQNGSDWPKTINWFEKEVKWKDLCRSKHEKLEEAEGVWEFIQ
jgi:hypothetical protein